MAGDRPIRVLVVRVGAMGDVLHGLPAVSALRTRVPDAQIGWVVDPRWVPLLCGSAGSVVDRVHRAETALWKAHPLSAATARSVLALRREMREAGYDVCVDLQGTLRSAVIATMSGAPRVLGPAEPRERLARRFYGEPVRTHARSVIAQACELLGAAVGERLVPARVTIPHDKDAEQWCTRRIGSPAACLLVPGGGWGAKRWPTNHFAELGRRLRSHGERVLVNASGEDDDVSQEVAAGCGAERIVCDVAELIAMTRSSKLVVGGDTGPVHLAAALGRPTVALFGPTDPERNGPSFPNARVRVLRHPESARSYKRRDDPDPGLSLLTVDEVFGAAETLLQEGVDG